MHEITFPWWTILPFIGLLLSIAILPLAAPHWWEDHKHKAWIGLAFSLPIVLVILQHEPSELGRTLHEYLAFIVLLGSLFVVAGGIVLEGDLRATPAVNTAFLAVGSVLANLIGTTGASMVLIRPFLRTNSERRRSAHLPVFFIFTVSNIGGCLTPLGDPPLFLGFLRGVPFLWTLSLWPEWLVMIGALLTLFYAYDAFWWGKETAKTIKRDLALVRPLRLRGRRNLLCLAGILWAVFLPEPWREVVMVAMGWLGYRWTPPAYRKHNEFTFLPIAEVAILFAGIFITMVPALVLLRAHGHEFGVTQPWQFFWLTGGLSAFLDNAPTYLAFVSLGQGLGLGGPFLDVPERILQAISLGAVFMGANTYIGNGPNFMVKAIAEEMKVKMPSFFGYMAYSATILLPLFLVVTLVFFR
ncbi:MAG: sodium:proton antiporter [Candidatus Omnitrophota bacterium]|nr:sodium:proton antiporter [Candidatus Omnitrophota bacterium]